MKKEQLTKFFKNYGGHYFARTDGMDSYFVSLTTFIDIKPDTTKQDLLKKLDESKEVNNRKWNELIQDAKANL